jgi:ubiquinone/menaquinone biosynthesis C-methylase UbiE
MLKFLINLLWPKKEVSSNSYQFLSGVGRFREPEEGMTIDQLKVSLKLQEQEILNKVIGTPQEIFEREAIVLPLDEVRGYESKEQMKRVHAILDAVGTGRKVLDVCGGSGYISRLIQLQGNDVTCTDISEIHHQRAIWINKVKHIVCRAEKLPFPDESFDCVVLGECLEHGLTMSSILSEAERVLDKRKGKLVITIPHNNWIGNDNGWQKYPEHLQEIHIKDIDNLMLVMVVDRVTKNIDDYVNSNRTSQKS